MSKTAAEPVVGRWDVETAYSAELLRLVRILRAAPEGGFRLVLLEWNDPTVRSALIAHLEDLFPASSKLELSFDQPTDFTALQARLAQAAQAHSAVHVLGLELWHGLSREADQPRRSDTFQLLNYRRENLAETCPAVLLIWVTPADLRRFGREAPDLWAWRTAALDFTRELEPTLPISARPELDGAERSAREARLKEIESYLTSSSDSGRAIGRLHIEAGDIAYDLGEWQVARSHLSAAAELFREANDVHSAAHAERVRAMIDFKQGRPDAALDCLRRHVLPLFEQLGDARSIALTQGSIADVLESRGELEEALRIRREEELPVYDRLGDVRSRAVTLGKIANVLTSRGELDEALRIRREEELPIFERLGDVRSRAITLGKIADVLASRGELEEVLRIRREEELPVYNQLGDVRSRAVTLGQIADVLTSRGELEEALRIRREEELPVYERLGDVKLRAITLGQIADVLELRGEVDEALRIQREEVLPVYEKLGAVRELIVGRANLAVSLLHRGREDDEGEALQLLKWSESEATSRGYAVARVIADLRQEAEKRRGKNE